MLSISSINMEFFKQMSVWKIFKSAGTIPVNLSLEPGEMKKGDCREQWQLLKIVT